MTPDERNGERCPDVSLGNAYRSPPVESGGDIVAEVVSINWGLLCVAAIISGPG
jgi:hypothetical protein